MNLQMLTLKEILRVIDPETPLEKRLFDFLEPGNLVDLDVYQCPECVELELTLEDAPSEIEIDELESDIERLKDRESYLEDFILKVMGHD